MTSDRKPYCPIPARSMRKVALLSLALCSWSYKANALTPRKQLEQLAEQLRAAPSAEGLREDIINLAATMKPKPAIPEDARKAFMEGVAIAKTAQDPKQQTLAIDSFNEALKWAPWWGDAYYNLAVAQELSGQYDDAEGSLRLYLLTKPGGKEARAAQDRIYGLSGKKRVAQAAAQEAEQKRRAESLEGYWQLVFESGLIAKPTGYMRFYKDNGTLKVDGYPSVDHMFNASISDTQARWQLARSLTLPPKTVPAKC